MQEKTKITTIKDFYREIDKLKKTKEVILNLLILNKKPSEKLINLLNSHLKQLKSIKKKNNSFILISDQLNLSLKLNYEISELEKDIIFLEKGEKALLEYFKKIHKDFKKQSHKLKNYLKNQKIDFFITDRDGTINNYCETYLSSIQSIYNAFFLYKFSKKIKKLIILTSGPLNDFEKVNILSKGNFIFAGSKAREFKYLNSKTHRIKISKNEKKLIDSLEKSITKLLLKKRYKIFKFIGSGFQKKHGEITIARQNIINSIPQKQSIEFLYEIKKIVKKLDPNQMFLEINDTKLDIEIMLKSFLKTFDKGKGLEFLLNKSKINLSNTLVSGDTNSDLPLLKSSKNLSKKIYCIFVTKNKTLKTKIRKIHKNSAFVSSPDILIYGLYQFSKT
jgi:hydroxymethylpyrimidine pyrophosphatase-like HAD family hydrolase